MRLRVVANRHQCSLGVWIGFEELSDIGYTPNEKSTGRQT